MARLARRLEADTLVLAPTPTPTIAGCCVHAPVETRACRAGDDNDLLDGPGRARNTTVGGGSGSIATWGYGSKLAISCHNPLAPERTRQPRPGFLITRSSAGSTRLLPRTATTGFVTGKLARLPARTPKPATVGAATDAFLDQADLAVTTRRVYSASLAAFADGVGQDSALAELEAAVVAAWFAGRYRHAAPATWNREIATLPRRGRLVDQTGLAGRRPDRHPRAASGASRPDPGLDPPPDRVPMAARRYRIARENPVATAVWSAARTSEILGLDIADLDLASNSRKAPTVMRRAAAGSTSWKSSWSVFWLVPVSAFDVRVVGPRPARLPDRRNGAPGYGRNLACVSTSHQTLGRKTERDGLRLGELSPNRPTPGMLRRRACHPNHQARRHGRSQVLSLAASGRVGSSIAVRLARTISFFADGDWGSAA